MKAINIGPAKRISFSPNHYLWWKAFRTCGMSVSRRASNFSAATRDSAITAKVRPIPLRRTLQLKTSLRTFVVVSLKKVKMSFHLHVHPIAFHQHPDVSFLRPCRRLSLITDFCCLPRTQSAHKVIIQHHTMPKQVFTTSSITMQSLFSGLPVFFFRIVSEKEENYQQFTH